MNCPTTNLLRLVLALLLVTTLAADEARKPGRIVIRDCPEESAQKSTGKHAFGFPGTVLRKILWCDLDPGKAKSAALRVCMRVSPYYTPLKRHYSGALDVPGFEPRELIVRVNGEEVFRGPLGVAAVEGWREYSIRAESITRGKNTIELTQAGGGDDRVFYVATSKGSKAHSFQSRNRGRTFAPLPDELLIQIALGVDAETMASSAHRRRFSAGWVHRAPRLAGDLSDPAWGQAVRVGGFVTRNGTPSEEAPTEAFVLCARDCLYVGFVCREPRIADLVANCTVAGGPVWNDDCVELHLDPANAATAMCKWIINPRGVVWDGLAGPSGLDEGYNSAAKARGRVGKDRWTVEVGIPYAALPCPPRPGEVWGINVCRARRAGTRQAEFSSWSPTRGDFTDPARLGEIAFEPAEASVILRVLSRGARSTEPSRRAGNVFRVQARNTGDTVVTARLEVRTDDELYARERAVPGGATTVLDVAYEISGESPPLSYRLLVDGRRAYDSQLLALPAPAAASRARVWLVPDPLFEELLSTQVPKAPRTCALMWAHPIVRVPMLRDTAKCLATRYVLDEMCREFVRHGVVVLGWAAAAHQRGVPSLCYPRMAPRDALWNLDPASIEYAVDDAKRRLPREGQVVWGAFAGDEPNQAALREGAELMAAPPADYSYIHEADQSVKREFGGGRWGIPKGSHDFSPYRWIAFRRWCNARLRERHARLQEVVKQHRDGLPLVSFNPQGCVQSLEWSAQAQYFDIFTHQVVPRGSDTSARTGFFTKLLVDLTGKDVWPCVHVEHYKVARTPEETVEVLSQVVRNGGTGFHLFLSDISNSNKRVGDTRLCYFGSPRRYHTIMNVIDLVRTMPRPVYPATRVAVLFNDDTIASQPYRNESEHSRRTETCYLALGPVARSWFTFVDCAQLLATKGFRERFDTLYVPAARYQRPKVVAALRRFVQQGGTLVCGDASAFQTDALGNDTASSRTELFGVEAGDALPARKLTPQIADLGGVLPLTSRALELVAQAPAVKVLATYEDGRTAATLNPVGEGRAVLFGSTPFHEDAIGDAAWQEFYTRLVRWLGAPTGLDIWRFRFPDRVIWREPQEPGLCLTNNHVLWREERPSSAQNSGLNGSYRYNEPPDALPGQEVVVGSIPFDKGRLTDRRRSILAEKEEAAPYSDYALPATHWTESWSTPKPLSVTFDLRRAWIPLCAKLWFCGTLPDLTVEGSADDATWHPLGQAEGLQAGADVHDLTTDLTGVPCRYVRLNFGPRPVGQRMTLVETEVWGKALRP